MSTLSATLPFPTHPHFQSAPRAAASSEPSAPHGKKRPADSSLENEQRLSKRFDLLNLDKNGSLLYIPVPGSSSSSSLTTTNNHNHNTTTQPTSLSTPIPSHSKRSHLSSSPDPDDTMDIDPSPSSPSPSTPELEFESTPAHPIFLPDIEKHLSKLPTHVLRGEGREIHHLLSSTTPSPAVAVAGGELQSTRDNQLVLYSVPGSLTVPEEQDRVRRAIAEARRRVRERVAVGDVVSSSGAGGGEVDGGRGEEREGDEGEAMDLD